MKTRIQKLIIPFVLSMLSLTSTHALIPFTQAKGMLANTKDEYKQYSPFWGMIAVHGNMLENIRFFGNYTTTVQKMRDEDGFERNHTVDQGQDSITILIKKLFNSPDGVQFVATTYEADPAGNLSRHLEAIDPIIGILLSTTATADKITQIKQVLDGIIDINIDNLQNMNPEDYPESIRKLVLTQLSSKNPAERIVSEIKGGITINKKIQIDPQEEFVKNEIEKMKKEALDKDFSYFNESEDDALKQEAQEQGIPVPNIMPTGARNALIKLIMERLGGEKSTYSVLSDKDLGDLAQQNAITFDFKENEWKQNWRNNLIKKLRDKLTADKEYISRVTMEALKEFASEHKLSFDETKSSAELIDILAAEIRARGAQELESHLNVEQSQTSPSSYQAALKEQIDRDNQIFAQLLVKAFDDQKKWANPQNLNHYLYPENIVITALLGFFVQVADDEDAFKMLPTVMKEGWQRQPEFTAQDYQDLKKKYISEDVNLELLKNDEDAFLMVKGFEAYENPFVYPINYRPDTLYQGRIFPDCGETSLRNVLGIFLSAYNGGKINPEALKLLKQKIKFPEGQMVDQASPVTKMINFFIENNDSSTWSSLDNHNKWANIVSNLNNEAVLNLSSIQYGRKLNLRDMYIYEIKSIIHPDKRGIVNMLNVIAQLIPDEILNQTWDANRSQRLNQVAKKLNRLCELLSREGLELSWLNAYTNDQTIKDEFPHIVFNNFYTPVFKWRFEKGHFQLDSLATSDNDWRLSYQTIDEKYFQNEWMAGLFLKSNEKQWLTNNTYGSKFPLALVYQREIRSVDGAIKTINFVFYNNIMNNGLTVFQPLIPRWIEKSIFLNDEFQLNRISLVFYALKDKNIPIVQKIIDSSQFSPIKENILKMESANTKSKYNPLELIIRYNLPNILKLMSINRLKSLNTLDLEDDLVVTNRFLKDLIGLKELNLKKNTIINNDGIRNLTELKKLNLDSNTKITDDGLKDLKNLISLSLNTNNKITDEGLKNLTNLEELKLFRNSKITNEGIKNLKNLKILGLNMSFHITDEGLENLTNLENLDLSENDDITHIKHLTGLRHIGLRLNKIIKDDDLMSLKNLESLDLSHNQNISGNTLKNLTKINSLTLTKNEQISDDDLLNLTGLTSLDLSLNNKITNKGLKNLINLESLVLRSNSKITDEGIKHLTNLSNLNLERDSLITIEGLKNMRKLKILDLSGNYNIDYTYQDIDELKQRNPGLKIVGERLRYQ